MAKQQKTYTREFKVEAVQLVKGSGKPMSQIARELGISNSALSKWCKQFANQGEQAFPGSGLQTAQEEELRCLRRELEVTRQERDILKKGVSIFSPQPGEEGVGGAHCAHLSGQSRLSTAVRACTRCDEPTGNCGRKRVARRMREQGLSAKSRTHRTRTTDSQHEHPVAPNLLNRDGARECAQYQVGG